MAGWKTATGQSVEVGIHGISSDGECEKCDKYTLQKFSFTFFLVSAY